QPLWRIRRRCDPTRRSSMKHFPIASLLALVLAVPAAPALAHADGVTVVGGQFTDRVERSRPVGDAAALATARTAIYWVEVANPGAPTQVTLVWKADGREVSRQALDVGH